MTIVTVTETQATVSITEQGATTVVPTVGVTNVATDSSRIPGCADGPIVGEFLNVMDYFPPGYDTENLECREYIQNAIDDLGVNGNPETLYFPSRIYSLLTPGGEAIIYAYAPGETPEYHKYFLRCPSGVRLVGDSGAELRGTWNELTGDTNLDAPIGICLFSGDSNKVGSKAIIQKTEIIGLRFFRLIMGVANVSSWTAMCRFENLFFTACGIGLYFTHLERCYFDIIQAQTVMCTLAAGGTWVTTQNQANDIQGLTDKCYFGWFSSIYRTANGGIQQGGIEDSLDEYFDKHFFKTSKNSLLQPPGSGPGTEYPYHGVSGRVIYIMSRYSRPNVSNTFVHVDSHYMHRSPIWVDDAQSTNTNCTVYGEVIGYTNQNGVRTDPVGGPTYTDPYLGPGVRLPWFVKGISAKCEIQFGFLRDVMSHPDESNSPTTNGPSQSPISNFGLYPVLAGETAVLGNRSFPTIGGRYEYYTQAGSGSSPQPPTVVTRQKINAGNFGRVLMVMSSRNTGAGTNTAFAVYLLHFAFDGDNLPAKTLLAGTDFVTFGADAEGYLTITAGDGNNRHVVYG